MMTIVIIILVMMMTMNFQSFSQVSVPDDGDDVVHDDHHHNVGKIWRPYLFIFIKTNQTWRPYEKYLAAI